jgi:hypothetical protein
VSKSRGGVFIKAPALVVVITATAIVVSDLFPHNIGATVQPQPTATYYFDAANGLNLTLSLNSVSIKQGQVIQIVTDLANTLDHNQTLPKANRWPPAQGLILTACGNIPYPLGVAICRGYYTNQNISADTSLWMFSPASCPPIF